MILDDKYDYKVKQNLCWLVGWLVVGGVSGSLNNKKSIEK